MAGTAIKVLFDVALINATVKATAETLAGTIRKGNEVILIFQ